MMNKFLSFEKYQRFLLNFALNLFSGFSSTSGTSKNPENALIEWRWKEKTKYLRGTQEKL
jgi:hypothetical protein